MPKGQKPKNGFKPGKSGNPTGRPKKGTSFAEFVRNWLEENDNARRLAMMEQLADSKPEVLLAYAYGKPVESVEVAGLNGEALIMPIAIAIAQMRAKAK